MTQLHRSRSRGRRPRIAALVLIATVFAACNQAAPAATGRISLTILAAASLEEALADVKRAYEASKPGLTLVLRTDSSAALATQIEQAAPADVFLSADTTYPRKLADSGFAAGDPVVFAGNELIIIVPTDGPTIQVPLGLAVTGTKIIAAGTEVPITRYAEQALAKLATLPGYPADFASKYAANVVSREENVKAVVGKIELGEGDAAIVYVTDARASGKVAEVKLPDQANVRASYAGVVVKASAQPAAAKDFLFWLADIPGQQILTRFGFLPVAPP